MSVDMSGRGGVDLSGSRGVPPPASAGYGGGGASSSGYSSGGYGGGVAAAAFSNPTVQAQVQAAAYEQAQASAQVAREGAHVAIQELGKYIKEGPAGISILCFLGGLVTTLVGFLGLFSFSEIFTAPFTYILHMYLTGFGLIAAMLEADTTAMSKMKVLGKLAPLIESYQMQIIKRANFLTELTGRGLFYVFVGSLAVTQCFVCVLFLVGLWNVLMGIICILMSFGVNPVEHIQAPHAAPEQQPMFESKA